MKVRLTLRSRVDTHLVSTRDFLAPDNLNFNADWSMHAISDLILFAAFIAVSFMV